MPIFFMKDHSKEAGSWKIIPTLQSLYESRECCSENNGNMARRSKSSMKLYLFLKL
jgi:hypothetical protein